MLRTALLSMAFVVMAFALLVGVGLAADIFSVDRDGTVRLRISSSGATAIAATDDVSAGLSVTQNGVASAVESNGRTLLLGKQGYTLTGTVAKAGTTTVTGDANTRFTREVRPGDRIEIPGGTTERRVVTAVLDDQTLTVSSAFADTISGQPGTITQCAAEISTTAGLQQPIITLTQDPASPANNQALYLQYQFRNNAGTLVPTGANLKFIAMDVTAGSEDVDVAVGAYGAGAIKEILRTKGETGYIGIGTGQSVTTMLDINNASSTAGVRIRSTKTPTSTADASGSVGDIAWDTSYLYIKTSTGWKRVALATW